MNITTSEKSTNQMGPLTRIVFKYSEMIEQRAVAGGAESIDWTPFEELVAVDEFKRVGAYLEVMNWEECTAFLTEWAGSTRFETTVFEVTEVGRSVFLEIEERHYKGDDFIRKNVIAVFRFNDQDKIRHLDIYEQAEDSGQWIIDAAKAATGASRPVPA